MTLFDDVAGELGIDPANPHLDQFRAAVHQVDLIAARFEAVRINALPAVAFRLDTEPAPPPGIAAWLSMHADDVPNVRRCRHGSWFTPTILWAGEPHRALCPRCDDTRNAELVAAERALPVGARMDCDFCGLPRNPLGLRIVVVPLVSVLVRGMACPRCLNPEAVLP